VKDGRVELKKGAKSGDGKNPNWASLTAGASVTMALERALALEWSKIGSITASHVHGRFDLRERPGSQRSGEASGS